MCDGYDKILFKALMSRAVRIYLSLAEVIDPRNAPYLEK